MSTLSEPTGEQLAELASCVGEGGTLDPGSEAGQAYLVEPRGLLRGRAAAILRPAATDAVAAVLGLCNRHRIGVVPYGGGTGLVGGQVMPEGPRPVVLSLERMDRVRAILPEDGVIVAEAGVVLADLQAAAERAGRLFPLSLAAEGSCRIGGNLATNAGGVQVLRYGNARELCLGIEAVLADGSVVSGVSGLRPLRKDNTGYDLKSLLIGSEGTLGVITAAALKLFPLPGETVTAMLSVADPQAALALFQRLRERLDDALSGFELISGQGIAWLAEFHPDKPDPLAGAPAWRVLLEATGPAGSGLGERVEAALGAMLEAGLASDGAVAASEAQRAHMWWQRETLPEANRRVGAVSAHDISLPLSAIARFIEQAGAAVAAIDPGLRVNCFGHLGDGNLHYNVFPPEGRRAAECRALAGPARRAVHDLVDALGGSISAEHGIGRMKRQDLARYGDPAKLAAMRAIKAALDPRGILNPGAVLQG
ncbi:MAG TPA: FAD-binding oxidoreductase [Thermohalobaculum sp.]|nr:FAD-binding oxidoreductase [Thermohalobaculum sp.]